MKYFLNLIRWPNLLIVILTQYLTRNCLVIDTTLHPYDFALLVFSTVLIAAAGYIINDYYDVDTDKINKPHKVIISNFISKKRAINFYWVFNLIGILLGFYVAYKINKINLGYIQILCAGLLFFYSTTYKGMVLIGNIIISFLSSLSIIICGIYEPSVYGDYNMLIIGAYSVFAFLLSMSREIVKDIEDMEGDALSGHETLPIVYGIKKSKNIALYILLLTIAMLLYVQIEFISGDWISEIYFTLAVQIPLLYLVYYTYNAKDKSDYHKSGFINKLIMLSGILSMLVFYYSL